MKRIIGYLKDLNIQLFAKSIYGNIRPLKTNDTIYSGEMVVDNNGMFVPDALRNIDDNKADKNRDEIDIKAHLHTEDKDSDQIHQRRLESTTSTDEIVPDPNDEININAKLHSYDFFDEGSGIVRPQEENEVDINARLWEYDFKIDNDYSPFSLSSEVGNSSSRNDPLNPINPPTPPLVEAGNESITLMEGGNLITGNILANDNLGIDGMVVNFTYTKEDGSIATGVVGSTVDTIYGTLTIQTNGNYIYISDPQENHSSNNSLFDTITYTITNNHGTTYSSKLIVEVTDDIPIARADNNSVTEDNGLLATGNVVTSNDTMGADKTNTPITKIHNNNINADGIVGSAFVTQYGTLTIHQDGTYNYRLDNNNIDVQHLISGESLIETYQYTITDADGDSSTATLTITINSNNDIPNISAIDSNSNDLHPNGDATVYESALSTGSNPTSTKEQTVGTITIDAKDGLQMVTIGGRDINESELLHSGSTPIIITTMYGEITIDDFTPTDTTHRDGSGTIHYTYILKSNTIDHSIQGMDGVTDSIPISVTDRNNDTGSDNIEITIVDDIPMAKADANDVTEDDADQAGYDDGDSDSTIIGGNVFGTTNASSGDVADQLGADNANINFPVIPQVTIGKYGKLILQTNGEYIYS